MKIRDCVSPVLLVGGLGTRLRSAVPDLPKALAPVAGKPFLAWILETLAQAGFSEALLCTGYQGKLVQETFGTEYASLSLTYSEENSPLGTGGALRLAASLLKSKFALVLNGDSICETNLLTFCENHLLNESSASMLLTHVEDTSRYGQVDCDAHGLIKTLKEKTGVAESGWINAGIYILPVEWLLSIPENSSISLEQKLFPLWLPRGFYGVKTSGLFIDIGTPESLKEAEHVLQKIIARQVSGTPLV